ncbi:MAG: hypothetical protein HOC70_07670 [Gammaproteobacteria bacterium]|jgi:hypothetical protein|nr:hypothetical protein [Gammaproteobacteria bacterium]MBT4493108.1 hypothetical protein [Gammaproteobacteria bacterium]MBT7370871.1 hypothetical protein [Gammaproteobacteria bacterium]
MAEPIVPNFGELLAEHLNGVPPDAYPFLLSQLERTAAARYRGWAEDVPEHREGILRCADAEDEIADRVEALFPPSDEHRELVGEIIPKAKATYYSAFEPYTPVEQMFIQANAERQGAEAWQTLKALYPDQEEALDALSVLELSSAEYLDDLLPSLM